MIDFRCNCGETIAGTRRDIATHLRECATIRANEERGETMNVETAREVIANLRVEYYGVLDAAKRHNEQYGVNFSANIVDFYGFLLRRGFSRQQLSAYGISRKNALTWCDGR